MQKLHDRYRRQLNQPNRTGPCDGFGGQNSKAEFSKIPSSQLNRERCLWWAGTRIRLPAKSRGSCSRKTTNTGCSCRMQGCRGLHQGQPRISCVRTCLLMFRFQVPSRSIGGNTEWPLLFGRTGGRQTSRWRQSGMGGGEEGGEGTDPRRLAGMVSLKAASDGNEAGCSTLAAVSTRWAWSTPIAELGQATTQAAHMGVSRPRATAYYQQTSACNSQAHAAGASVCNYLPKQGAIETAGRGVKSGRTGTTRSKEVPRKPSTFATAWSRHSGKDGNAGGGAPEACYI